MSRIRSVKPIHWTDKNLPNITLPAHLLWIGTWNFSDDEGVIEADPILMRSNIFPRRTDVKITDIEGWLAELVTQRFLLQFNYLGVDYYISRTFSIHQKIDKKQKSRIPDAIIRRTVDESAANVPDSVAPERIGEDRSRKGVGKESTRAKALPAVPAADASIFEAYKKLDKTKQTLVDFVRAQKPVFPDPYVDLWKIFAAENKMSSIKELSPSRKKKFGIRIKETGFDFLAILKKAKSSEFILKGNWFTFDWVLENDKNYLKLLEGNYDSKAPAVQEKHKTASHKETGELQYLVERYREGSYDPRNIPDGIYKRLEVRGLIPKDFMNEFTGTNEEQASQAVQAWLRIQDGNTFKPILPK